MRHAVLGGGKRIRPCLLFAIAKSAAASAPTSAQLDFASRAACAIELIHCASLVHDDLPCFDDADTRRGRPSTHAAFGESNATLAGDALIVLAFEALADPDAPLPHGRLALVHRLARATGSAEGIIGGQGLEDVLASSAGPDGPFASDAVERYHELKTAALFRLAAHAGAMSADAEHVDQWADLGSRLGLAFQLADDLLDVEGPDNLGKPTGQDAAHDRPNQVLCSGRHATRARFVALLDEAITQVMELAEDPGPMLAFIGRLADVLRPQGDAAVTQGRRPTPIAGQAQPDASRMGT